jgi:hypothetical protein
LSEIFGNENIVGSIKSGRIRWARHVILMDPDRTAKKILVNNVTGERARERPRKRWIDSVEEDLEKLNVTN